MKGYRLYIMKTRIEEANVNTYSTMELYFVVDSIFWCVKRMLLSNWSFQKSKMPGISAKLEMVLSNDSTKFEPFLYGKKNGAGSQKIGHFGPSMTACTKQNIFQTPCTIFFTLWKWLKFGRIIAEHHPNLCWVPWHFRFLKRPVTIYLYEPQKSY